MERRFFLKTGALATGSLMVPLSLLAQESKIKLGIVGCGWWASDFLMPHIMSSGKFEITALCDVDSTDLLPGKSICVPKRETSPGGEISLLLAGGS